MEENVNPKEKKTKDKKNTAQEITPMSKKVVEPKYEIVDQFIKKCDIPSYLHL